MPKGITVTVAWIIKPELANEFVETLRGMFPETRLHKRFRNIRLLRSDFDPNHFMLIAEWDEAQNFHDYVQFRTGRSRRNARTGGDDCQSPSNRRLGARPARGCASVAPSTITTPHISAQLLTD